VPGLVASAVPTGGSVSNVDGLIKEEFHAGIVQSDVAYWAYTGTGPFRTRKRNENLCAVSSLYKEAFHLVRAGNSKINSVMELKGAKVALGKPGSGALIGAQLVVRAYGFAENKDFRMVEADFQSAKSLIQDGSIDAFAYVTAFPNQAIKEMTEKSGARVVPVSGAGRDKLVKRYPFYTGETIPAGTYAGQDTGIDTLAVPALWISRKSVPDDLIYSVTKAFWKNPSMRSIMDGSHPRGQKVTLKSAFDGVSVPYCDGAQKFYREIRKMR
jgi:TRAP transporter TAXI family solute receptor